MTKIRSFISLEIPLILKKEIKSIQEEFKKSELIKAKYTFINNIHLTLKFLGEISEEKLDKVKEKLNKVNFKSFKAKLGEAGLFLRKKRSILWLSLEGSGVFGIQKEIDEILSKAELFEKEKRFMSHITIARIKEIKNLDKLKEKIKTINPQIAIKVVSFSLMKSTLRPEGPIYEEIKKFYLK